MPERPSGEELNREVNRALIRRLTGAQVAGGVIVFVYLVLLLPIRNPPPLGEVLAWNGPVFVLCIVFGSIVGPRWGSALARGRSRWLLEERPPTAKEQRLFLRSPYLQLRVVGALWTGLAVLFGLINARFSVELGLRVAVGIVMGALVTSAISYLLGERTLRPITARALEVGVPARPVAPGVVVRTVLAWALATGVPLFGIAMVMFGVIHGDTPRTNTTAWSVVVVVGVGLLAGAGAIVAAAKSIADPIRGVREALARVQDGDVHVEVPVDDASEVGLLQAGFNRMVAGLRERERLHDLFGRHVGVDVARQALEAGVQLGGEVREAAVVFVDVIGSTAVASELPPEEVVARLNRFFEIVLDVVHAQGGLVNKFEGDAALCVFGVPTPSPDPAGCALATARELARRLEAESPLDAAVGVSAGEVVAGNVGAAERYEYTVIGDAVNEASRLTELAKEHDPRVLASGRAVGRSEGDEADCWRLGDEVVLRGRSEPTILASPVGSAVRAG